jgi:hypothetical protein
LNFSIVNLTPFELCKRVRCCQSCLFAKNTDWAVTSVKKIYGVACSFFR